MRKFLVRWWQTPEWNEQERRRKIGDWKVVNIDSETLARIMRSAVTEFTVYEVC
jgi:hypothetical protein